MADPSALPPDISLKLKEVELEIEREKTRQKEKDLAIEEVKATQLKTKLQIRKEENKKNSMQYDMGWYGAKRRKLYSQQLSSMSSDRYGQRSCFDQFYEEVREDIQPFDFEYFSSCENAFQDDMMEIFKKRFGSCQFKGNNITEQEVQITIDNSINELFHQYYNSTSLKYLNTSRHKYISNRAPDCTFIYKNINISINQYGECECLQDFVTCIGEIKSPSVSLDNSSANGQLCSYLIDLLRTQKRKKIYGFLTNLKYIRFYCVEKSDGYRYIFKQSKALKMVVIRSNCLNDNQSKSSHDNQSNSSNDNQSKSLNDNQNKSTQMIIIEDTIKIFIKFLTMKPEFYGYNALKIDPDEKLYNDDFNIQIKLGSGATSAVYQLDHEDNETPGKYKKSHVIKISKRYTSNETFLNEINILQELKQLTDINNFNAFFSNILFWSPKGNFIVFETRFESLPVMNSVQAKQLIEIVEHLYNCRILHRDIRPDNVMVDGKSKHIKLIDFGFARIFDINESKKELTIQGVVSYADINFLRIYSEALSKGKRNITYEYDRCFDLICSINVIMFMKDDDIKMRLEHSQQYHLKDKIDSMYDIWIKLRTENDNYRNLLDLAFNLTSTKDFIAIKNSVEQLFQLI